MKFGTAVGTDDLHLMPFLKELLDEGLISFVELYTKKDASLKELVAWESSDIPIWYLQAEHDGRAGIDEDSLAASSFVYSAFRDFRGLKRVVFDAGYDEKSLEVAKKYALTIPENMPYKTAFGRTVFNMPEHVTGWYEAQFCLDFTHAWIAAEQTQLNPRQLITEFIKRHPCHFHLTDTDGTNDHLPMGEGVLDLDFIFTSLKENHNEGIWGQITITVETDNVGVDRTGRIREDLEYVKKRYAHWRDNTSKSRVY